MARPSTAALLVVLALLAGRAQADALSTSSTTPEDAPQRAHGFVIVGAADGIYVGTRSDPCAGADVIGCFAVNGKGAL
jgi:hypothetical protein